MNPKHHDLTKGKKLKLTPMWNIYTQWSKERLIELVEDQNAIQDIVLNKQPSADIGGRIARRIQIAIQQYLGEETGSLEFWKAPAHYNTFPPSALYFMAAALSYSTKWGEYLTAAQMNYLSRLDVGSYEPYAFTKFVAPEIEDMPELALPEDFDPDDAMSSVPKVLRLERENMELGFAFYMTMLSKTVGSIPHPFLGEFRMTKTGLEAIDDLGLQEIRLVISQKGIWLSIIMPNGNFSPAWWCPDGDSFLLHFGYRFTWIFRTFCACLWHDLHRVEKTTFTVRTEKAERRRGLPQKHEERVILLPRKQRHIEWAEARHIWAKGDGSRSWSVRAHYRRLAEWQEAASEQAIQNALDWHFPEPPFGYTFVKPFDVGDESLDRPPRIVAKGLQAAKVALARL